MRGLILLWSGCATVSLPGRSHRGPLPPADLTDSAHRLEKTVRFLSEDIGPRSVPGHVASLKRAQYWLVDRFESLGLSTECQIISESPAICNVVGVRQGSSDRSPIVVGAHFDGAYDTPGADDNASGVAALLELIETTDPTPERTILFVAWANEEPPWFGTGHMGSRHHAATLDTIGAALSLETLGYYDDSKGSQAYPAPFSVLFPNRGDFVGFVGNVRSRRLLRRVGRVFRNHEPFPSRGVALPGSITGVDWSDHASYWELGPALMVTDTAPFRNPHYHTRSDTADRLDFERMARVVRGLKFVIDDLANADEL